MCLTSALRLKEKGPLSFTLLSACYWGIKMPAEPARGCKCLMQKPIDKRWVYRLLWR